MKYRAGFSLLIILHFLVNGVAMAKESEDMGMLLRRVIKTETITADIAVKLAQMIFARHHSEMAAKQLPLKIEDLGDRWKVEGTPYFPPPGMGDGNWGAQLSIVIMKSNCQIMEFYANSVPRQP